MSDRPKPELALIDHDYLAKEQPAEKSVRRDEEPDLILISDDEDEPVTKRRAESLSPQEIAELQQTVIKLEKNYQGACRYARKFELQLEEAKKREAFLESRLYHPDNQPAEAKAEQARLVQELQEKLAEKSEQLENTITEALKREAQLKERVNFLTSEVAKKEWSSDAEYLKEKVNSLTKRIREVRAQVDEERKRERDRIAELSSHLQEATRKEEIELNLLSPDGMAQETNALRRWIVGLNRTICSIHDDTSALQDRVRSLTRQLNDEQQRARDEDRLNRVTIGELAKYKILYEKLLKQPQVAAMTITEQPAEDNDTESSEDIYAPPSMSKKSPKVHAKGHPTNLFQLCLAGSSTSMLYETAVARLRYSYNKVGKEAVDKYYKLLECEMCEEMVDNADVIAHFLSPAHCEKFRAHGRMAAVSADAFRHWMKQLQLASTAAAITTATPAVCAASVVTATPTARAAVSHEDAWRAVSSNALLEAMTSDII